MQRQHRVITRSATKEFRDAFHEDGERSNEFWGSARLCSPCWEQRNVYCDFGLESVVNGDCVICKSTQVSLYGPCPMLWFGGGDGEVAGVGCGEYWGCHLRITTDHRGRRVATCVNRCGMNCLHLCWMHCGCLLHVT